MHSKVLVTFFLLSLNLIAQENEQEQKIDSLYREDQFYFGVTYNVLQNKPSGLSQDSFSVGLNLGFLRDMPINESRTFAFAAGFGLSYQTYNQNLKIAQDETGYTYTIIEDQDSYKKNRFSTVNFDVPLEIRWRTSTPESHKFFRLYAGMKLSYVLLNNSKYISNQGDIKINNNKQFNSFQYGVYLATGYNTWNFYAYYGFNSIFNSDVRINGKSTELSTLNLGLQFYIL